MAEAVTAFDGVADSMAEVQHHAFAHIEDIVFNDISLTLTTAFDDFFPMIKDRLIIELFQDFKEGGVSAMTHLEVAHEGTQCLDVFQRDSVVQRRAHATQGLMPFQSDHAGALALFEKHRIERRVVQNEWNVHS